MKKIFMVLLVISTIMVTHTVVSAESLDDQQFKATGNRNPDNRIEEIGDFGPFPSQVDVFFSGPYKDLKMRFCPPGKPVLVTENNIEFSNGYAETYDPETGIDYSFEVWGDFHNLYTSMWIESANDARIVVRWRSALVAPLEGEDDPILAHKENYSGAPYGEGYGDWVDEVFYIYPDASRTRYSTIYTAFAGVSQPFGFERRPPNYIHEFSELIIWNYNYKKPQNTIHTKALTLINDEGLTKDISYSPYPDDFGSFEKSSIMRINLKSEWKPYIIGSNINSTLRPYEAEDDPAPFQSWSEFGRDHVTALGHLVNWSHYEQTENKISQVYLEGMIHDSQDIGVLYDIAEEWMAPAHLSVFSPGYIVDEDSYSPVDRAYHLTRTSGQNLVMKLSPDASKKLVKPVLVIDNWGQTPIHTLYANGHKLINGIHFRQGIEEDKLVLWIDQTYDKDLILSLYQ